VQTVLFLCPHGAAKSVLAAAYFENLAEQRGLSLHADYAGTVPDAEVSHAVAELLRAEGLRFSLHPPRQATSEDLRSTCHVVSMGCEVSDLNDLCPPGVTLDHWDDVPPVSQNLLAAREAIRAHVESLINTFYEDN